MIKEEFLIPPTAEIKAKYGESGPPHPTRWPSRFSVTRLVLYQPRRNHISMTLGKKKPGGNISAPVAT
jgi:hypothetical protein